MAVRLTKTVARPSMAIFLAVPVACVVGPFGGRVGRAVKIDGPFETAAAEAGG